MPTEKDPDAIVPGLYAAGEAACASVSERDTKGFEM
jgi:succinate dehydrogenase/fumarate reductase flavoprotein subunit